MIKITLRVLGKEWTQQGKTVADALSKFDLEWQEIKGRGVMFLTKGDKTIEKMFNAPQIRRMFNNKTACSFQAKNLELLLN